MRRKGSGRDENGLTPEDRRIWTRVSNSVAPPRARKAARVTPGAETPPSAITPAPQGPLRPPPKPPISRPTPASPVENRRVSPARPKPAPEDLEPRRKQRLSRERDPIEARIDLHGFGRFEAEDQLRGFLTSCQARGMRAVLVITGQGRMGGGVIRSAFAEWMQSPGLRGVVSGFTVAHQRHGGNGAFYVTLKRRV
ncbi:recombination and DNA strand exchange inhibitor protein [Brevundimonas sp. SH203]|uniref:Smr/MutS family protein n=1 Tax=Brevundimonas sp. SH203 TaxID=345167 RepID=UPI0009C65638|nr:Smr/MutS family protein [Brevundimonas sp. SH203]GAW41976.1 recombination and DNA strand exchange inhibitor protein [Brevundimonas sp. SH203]